MADGLALSLYASRLPLLKDAGEDARRLGGSKGGALVLYEGLERRVARPEFAGALERYQKQSQADGEAGGLAMVTKEQAARFQDESFWDAIEGTSDEEVNIATTTQVEVPSHLPNDDAFVVVAKDDVLDSMADFIARYLATVPEARSLPPAKLQAALATTLQELRGKSVLRRVFDWGRIVYRTTALTAGVWSLYENPWLARAIVSATYAGVKTLAVAGTAVMAL